MPGGKTRCLADGSRNTEHLSQRTIKTALAKFGQR